MDITPEFAGSASGFMNFGFGMAGIISPVVFGWSIDMTGRWDVPFIGSLAMLLIGAALAFTIHPQKRFAYLRQETVPRLAGSSCSRRRDNREMNMDVAELAKDDAGEASAIVGVLMQRARAAQAVFAEADQARTDEAVRALAWSLDKPEHARELAELAVADTGLGNVADKIIKKQRKTFGTRRDLLRVKSVGEIERDDRRGLVKFAKPIGVVGAVTPSTNPGATPVNKAMTAIKAQRDDHRAVSAGVPHHGSGRQYMREALEQIGLPRIR